MPTHIGIGFSDHPEPQHAVLQACIHVKNKLNSAETDLILVFASGAYMVPETLDTIARILKPKRLIGSSTGGLLLAEAVLNRGFALIGINSADIHCGISAMDKLDSQDMHDAGFELARKASLDLSSSHREVFLALGQGLGRNSSPFIRGAKEALGVRFPVLGAVSSGDPKHRVPSLFFQDQILQNAAVGLIFGGAVHMAISCKHRFKPLGKPRFVTSVEGPKLHAIDHKPAADFYKHFLGTEFLGAAYPLGVYLEESQQYLLRNVIDILEDGSIVCDEGIPPGAEVHLMISNKDACQASAVEAAEAIKASLGERPPKLVLVFESMARHQLLGPSAFGEIQAIKGILGNAVPLAGMCSRGEIGPFGTLNNIKNIYLHNESILMVAIA